MDTASREHGCARERIRVLGDNGDGAARLVELDVCGRRRTYRDVGGRQGFLFMDTTATTGGEVDEVLLGTPVDSRAGADRPEDDAAAGEAREPSAFERRVRTHIEDARAGILVCTGHAAAVVARWNPSDVRVTFTVRDADEAINGCVQAAIGEVLVYASEPAGSILHPILP